MQYGGVWYIEWYSVVVVMCSGEGWWWWWSLAAKGATVGGGSEVWQQWSVTVKCWQPGVVVECVVTIGGNELYSQHMHGGDASNVYVRM